MNLKLIGIIAVIAGCGGFGFHIAAEHRKEERYIRQFISILDQLQCELEYRMTPLPELCRIASSNSSGALRCVFHSLCEELEKQIAPDAACCMNAAIACSDLSKPLKGLLRDLGKNLGCFDLNGQLRGIEGVRASANEMLAKLTNNQEVRIRSYQTLGLCAGAALAILLL